MFIIIFAIIWILEVNLQHFPHPIFVVAMVLAIIETVWWLIVGLLLFYGLYVTFRKGKK